MNETIKIEAPLTPEQYRAELINERMKLMSDLTAIKADLAYAVLAKDTKSIAQLSSDRAAIIAGLADMDAELRQLKQDTPNPLADLHLIVQLVSAEISNSGLCNVDEAIARLNRIKEKLSAQQ